MSQTSLMKKLVENRLLRSPDEVSCFEQALAELAQASDPSSLPELHLILDDTCEQPEVMFSLVHFLESFEVRQQVQAFIQVLPDLVQQAAEWTVILHSRMIHDEVAHAAFDGWMRSLDGQQHNEIVRLIALAQSKVEQAANLKHNNLMTLGMFVGEPQSTEADFAIAQFH
jgi:hypothetical protein